MVRLIIRDSRDERKPVTARMECDHKYNLAHCEKAAFGGYTVVLYCERCGRYVKAKKLEEGN